MHFYTVTLEYTVTRKVEIISPDKMSYAELVEGAMRKDVEIRPDMPERISSVRATLAQAPCVATQVSVDPVPI